jgi:signal transduction histidine kinase
VLHEFLTANKPAIIDRARATVSLRPAPRATVEELAHGIPLFLDQLIDVLRRSDGSSSGAIDKSATEHGGALLRRGFTVAQVVHDYGGVCQAVTELADEMQAPISAADFHTFNRCLDDAIAQAVTEYAQQHDQSIAAEARARSGELAHELRNLLGTATLACDLVTTGKVALQGSTAGLLRRSLVRLTEIVNSSVAEIRIDAGLQAPERVSVGEFIEDVEVGAAIEASARGLILEVTPVEPGVDVTVDRQLLAAAVVNLLQNAFKFTRAHGRVSLKTSPSQDRVLIEIADECGGLPPGKADELFQAFERRGSDRTGMGLGLWISRKSVQADGGQIHVRDVPGTGCVFTIDLPRLPSAS